MAVSPGGSGMVGGGRISREFTVWCGLCAEWASADAGTVAQARQWARHAKWRLTKDYGWVCPNHKADDPAPPTPRTGGMK